MSSQTPEQAKITVKVNYHKSYTTISLQSDKKWVIIKVHDDFTDLLKYVAIHKTKAKMTKDQYTEVAEIDAETLYDLLLPEIINNNKQAKRLLALIKA